ncbi:glycosyltransferase family 4 protein [Geitlerinema calcuttense]|uniref:Glycosyltransferase n=1 Tax=Geitlerinema calcuttense NRMC-F 0142 TaxID=2922238 RepID=A0ABT7M021_9CYAN|nr:glycosyltransferase [Geitlerinema calcuttense]MDL5056985.1 glycosyltransferase [Geitlerinema calcuttense NRMC-F 0142]
MQYIALLGQRQSTADGVADYCDCLAKAMARQGADLDLIWVPWNEMGKVRSLFWLWQASQPWKNEWVIAQYTASAWSKRALPVFFLFVLLLLRLRGVRLAVMFHEVQGYPGEKLTYQIRRNVQLAVIQAAIRLADRAIVNVSRDRVPWLPTDRDNLEFIPVGSNIPPQPHRFQPGEGKTVAVFGLTSYEITPDEINAIAYALQQASQKLPNLRLVTLGRGSKDAEPYLQQALKNTSVELVTLGLLSPEEIAATLASSDVLLYVRGEISTRRTTAIAAIACGLPIVGYSGVETGSPIPDTGVVLVPEGDKPQLADALIRVLTDDALRLELHQRNLQAYEEHFSYDAIAKRFLQVLTP